MNIFRIATPEKRKILSRETNKRVRTYDHLIVPQSINDPETYQKFAKLHLIYSFGGILAGLICILFGMVLCFQGVEGHISWNANFLGAKSYLSEATPGVALFIVGLIIVFVTRFSVRVQKTFSAHPERAPGAEGGPQ